MWARQKAEIDALTKELADLKDKGLLEALFTPRQPGGAAIPKPTGTYSPSLEFRLSRLESMQRQVEAELARFAQFADTTITAQQQQAVDAAQQHAEQLARVSLGEPPPGVSIRWDRVPTGALTDLVGFTQDGSPLRNLLDTLGPDVSAGMRGALITGLGTGQNPRAIAALVRKEYGVGLNRALTISRTEILRAYRESTSRSFVQNRSVLRGWIRWSALGTRTCAVCYALHGSHHKVTETLQDHPNGRCHPAGTLVSGPAPVAASIRWYEGDMVTIKTAKGYDLAATPNHPILTDCGWSPIGIIQEGSRVVCHFGGYANLGDVKVQNVPTSVEDIVQAFSFSDNARMREAPVTSEDFHGDAADGQIAVIWADGSLFSAHDATLGKCLYNRCFLRPFHAEPRLTRLCTPDAFLARSTVSLAARSPSGPKSRLGIGGHAGHAKGKSFALSSKDTCPFSVLENDTRADAKLAANLIGGLAGEVEFDDIVHVSVSKFAGHVYSLQTQDRWYAAYSIIPHADGIIKRGGIVAHNCIAIADTKSWAELGFTGIPDRRAPIESGPDVFDNLPEEQQAKILGPEKYQAYSKGQIQLSDLVGYSRSKAWGTVPRVASLPDALKAAERRR